MVKIAACFLAASLIFVNFFLQVLPPIIKQPVISDTIWSALIAAAAVVIVAWLNRRDNKRTKEEMKAELKSEVGSVKAEVKTEVGDVKKEVTELKKNTDGQHTELMNLNKALSEKVGIDKGIEKSKAEHEAQSEKDKEANIAKGKIEGLAEAKAEQTPLLSTGTEPAKVEIVQPEDNPAPVTVVEKKTNS